MATASMPISWQARMIRTAISPRLATRTRRKGGEEMSPVGGPSLRKDVARSERDVAMLLSGVDVTLVGQDLEGANDSRPRLGRTDDVVDVAAGRGDVRVGELRLVLGDEPAMLRLRILGIG